MEPRDLSWEEPRVVRVPKGGVWEFKGAERRVCKEVWGEEWRVKVVFFGRVLGM